jgi:hypothetical protein
VCFVGLVLNLVIRWMSVSTHFATLQSAPPMATETVAELERFQVWFEGFYMPTSNRFGAIVIGRYSLTHSHLRLPPFSLWMGWAASHLSPAVWYAQV